MANIPPILGQQLMADSEAVVIASDQSAIPVSGTVSVSNFPATQPVTGTFFQTTQPVSAASLPLPTGAATETTVATLLTDTQLRATPVPVSGTITTGGLTDTQLRATPVPVSGTVTSTITGVSTEAKQDTQITTLNSIDTKLTSPLTVQAADLDIRNLLFATDKVDVSGSAVTVATLPLPTGAATSANQTTEITALGTLDTSINTLLKPASTLAAVTTVGTITNALPTGANTIGNTNQTLATAEFAKITDGVDTVEVATASTVPTPSNPALVVTLSPNVSTVSTAIAKTEDTSHVTGDVGIMALAVRNETGTLLTTNTGDYSPIATDGTGRLIVANEVSRNRSNFASVVKATTAEQTLVLGTAGEFHDVVSITATCAANNLLTFRFGTAGTIFATLFCANNTPNGGIHYKIPMRMTTTGQPITVTQTSATATTIVVSYVIN